MPGMWSYIFTMVVSLDITTVVRTMAAWLADKPEPIVTELAHTDRDPFRILITTVLSLRTKDAVTAAAAERLFALAHTAEAMSGLAQQALEEAIYPVGFYRVKARQILAICHHLVAQYRGRVPDNMDALLALPGVGRKTANLVLIHGFRKAGICVDTHVHRISNRLGYIDTKNALETEMQLRKVLPRELWPVYNDILVAFGQQLCLPVSPHCSRCPVRDRCARCGVTHSR